MMGGLGVALLAFVFGERPTEPPIDVMLMIAAVCTAAACLQASGGMDYLVKLAEKALRKYPPAVTFVAPLVAYVFTLFAGTGHVAYAILPVIAEVSRDAGVRPERPLSISVIASQQAITASPISAATVALLGLLAPANVTLLDILMVCIPATLVGVLAGALVVSRRGVELADDPGVPAAARRGRHGRGAQGRRGGRRRRAGDAVDGEALGPAVPRRRDRDRLPGVLPRRCGPPGSWTDKRCGWGWPTRSRW